MSNGAANNNRIWTKTIHFNVAHFISIRCSYVANALLCLVLGCFINGMMIRFVVIASKKNNFSFAKKKKFFFRILYDCLLIPS